MKTKIIASIVLSLALVTWGCNQSNAGEQENSTNTQVQQKQAPKQQGTPSGEADKFGRKPGDQHYGHNHSSSEGHGAAPKTNSAQPASGEPDKFGRKPGDPHYGHSHQ